MNGLCSSTLEVGLSMSRAFHKSSRETYTLAKTISCVLALLLVGFNAPVFCQQGSQSQSQVDKHTQKIKKYVRLLKRHASDDPVTVKLYDGTKIKGYIAEAEEDHFVVTDRKSGQSTSIDYGQVKDVTEGLGSKTKIGLVVAGSIGLFLVICAITHRCQE